MTETNLPPREREVYTVPECGGVQMTINWDRIADLVRGTYTRGGTKRTKNVGFGFIEIVYGPASKQMIGEHRQRNRRSKLRLVRA